MNRIKSSEKGTPDTSWSVDSENYDSDSEKGLVWLFFAGTVLGIAGIMRVIDGIWAFRYHAALPEGLQDAVLGSNLRTYGWIWLLVGFLLILASFAVMAGSQVGRWFGVATAGVAAISAVTWMPYYPVWSLVYVLLAVLAIYALVVYGKAIRFSS